MNEHENPQAGRTNDQESPFRSTLGLKNNSIKAQEAESKSLQDFQYVDEEIQNKKDRESPHFKKPLGATKGAWKLEPAELKVLNSELSHQANKEGYKMTKKRTKIDELREADLVKKIHELKAKKPLPEKEAAELKALYFELNAIKKVNTEKRAKVELTSEQRMSLKNKMAQAKSDEKDALKDEGEFMKERSELMDDNDKLGKDIDELSEEIKGLGNKTGKERADAADLLKSLRSKKRRLEDVLTGYKPDETGKRAEFLIEKLFEAVGIAEETEEHLEESRKKTGVASSETLGKALNEESRAGAEAGAAIVEEKTAKAGVVEFIKAQTHSPAEAGSVSTHTGEDKKTAPASSQKEKPLRAIQKVADGLYDYTKKESREMQKEMNKNFPKPHELIAEPMQPVEKAEVKPETTPVPEASIPKGNTAEDPASHKKTPGLTQGALDLLRDAKKGVPAFISKHMRRTLEANDVHISEHDTPATALEKLGEKGKELEKKSVEKIAIINKEEKTLMESFPTPNQKPNNEWAENQRREQEESVLEAVPGEGEPTWLENATEKADLLHEEMSTSLADVKKESLNNLDGVKKELVNQLPEGTNKEAEETVKKEFEALPPEEQKKVALGLHNIGFFVEEKKNQLFAAAFDMARGFGLSHGWLKEKQAVVTGFGGQKELVTQAGALDNWLLSFKENMQKNAEESRKKIEESEKTSFSQLTSIGAVTGNVLKYGRAFTDLLGVTALSSPLRYYTMGGMFFGQAVGAAKEARFKNAEVLEKTRVHDIEAAAEQAWSIYQKAKEGKNAVTKEELEKAYLDNIPQDILNRLKKDPEPGTASGILAGFVKRDVANSVKDISQQLDDNEKNESLDEADRAIERERILQKYGKHLKDLDRAVTQFGTIDAFALGAKYGETAAKALVGGIMAETIVLSIDKLWEKFGPLTHGMSESVPVSSAAIKAPTSFVAPLSTAGMMEKMATPAISEKILDLATIQKGEGVESALIRQLMDKPTDFGFKGDITDADALKHWADTQAHLAAGSYQGTGVSTSGINNVAYVLDKDASGALKVEEQLRGPDGKFHIVEGGPTTMNSYEYKLTSADQAPVSKDLITEGFPDTSTPTATVPKDVLMEGYVPPALEVAAPQIIPAPHDVTPVAPTEHPAASTEKVSYSKEGSVEKLTFDTAGQVDPSEAKKMVLNPNWEKTMHAHESPMGRGFDATIVQANAITVAGYEKALTDLELKDAGSSDKALALRKNIDGIIKDTESKYGDVFKNTADFNKPEQLIPTPSVEATSLPTEASIISSENLEVSKNPQTIADADKQFHVIVKTVWGGKGGFLGFGKSDGMEVFKGYEHKTIQEILSSPATGENKQVQDLLQESAKQTGVKWSPKEQSGDYIRRAIGVAIDKAPKAPNDQQMPSFTP